MNEQKTVQQIIDRSQHTVVMDGTGRGHSCVKVKIDDLRALEATLLALQTQLDHYTRISESGESLGGEYEERERRIAAEAQLERVERETIERCAKACESYGIEINYKFYYTGSKGCAKALHAYGLSLPSAKTATETEQQKG